MLSPIIESGKGGEMIKRAYVLQVICLLVLVVFAGCGVATRLLIKPDTLEYSKEQTFKVLSAQNMGDHLIRVTVLIMNETNDPQPFTPSQAYIATEDKQVIFSGIPQKQGYRQLPPITTTTTKIVDPTKIVDLTVKSESGPSLSQTIGTLVDNAKTQEWNALVEETITPCYIPPHTKLQGHLWFKWNKMQTVEVTTKYIQGNIVQIILKTPLAMHVITPNKELVFILSPEKENKIYY